MTSFRMSVSAAGRAVSLAFLSALFLPVSARSQERAASANAEAVQWLRQKIEAPVSAAKMAERRHVVSAVPKAASPPVNMDDSLALVALYDATGGGAWMNNGNWRTDRVATWYGVTVSGDRVTNLYLAGNNLTGSLPSALGDLTALETLNLGLNIFEDGENRLSGSIPAELGNLTELTLLWLDGNQLTGPIPESLGNLTNLESLDLGNFFGGNQLTGQIPATLGNLISLRSLRLLNNELSGPIPASLGNLPVLEYLELGGNMLSGSIPPELGNLNALLGLDLGSFFGGNALTGPIPSALGNLSNLESLTLSRNQLEGSIPPSLGQLSLLETL